MYASTTLFGTVITGTHDVPNNSIDKTLASLWIKFYFRTCHKPLPELMITRFIDAFMFYHISMYSTIMRTSPHHVFIKPFHVLTHWSRVKHRVVSKVTIIGPDNGLTPGRRKAIICTNAGILLIRTLGTNFSEILIEIHTFSLKNAFEYVVREMAAIFSRPQCFNNMSITSITTIGHPYEYLL